LRASARARLESDGVDSLLDDPRVLNALLTDAEVAAPPSLIFYVLVRQTLLEGGVDDKGMADFVASLVVSFGNARRAYRISERDEEEFHYLVDMIAGLDRAGERRAFLLRSHLGNFSLWLAGLFPDFLEARSRRRGAPPIEYYERMGRMSYQLASESRAARDLGVEELLEGVSRDFGRLRGALNRVSDRYLWPQGSNPVGRLLREVSGGGEAQ